MIAKRILIVTMVLMMGISIFSEISLAVVLISNEKALQKMFPDVDEVVSETRALTISEITNIKSKLGGKLVHYQKGSESSEVTESTEYTFYFGIKGGQKIRMAIIEEQPGKWGPVKFIVAVDMNTGKVQNLAVMSYKEKRGRPIARNNFLKQFFGKGITDPISIKSSRGIRKDIRAISGATISSDCACFAVKKVLAVYDEVFKNGEFISQKN